MSTIEISIPDSLKAHIEKCASEDGVSIDTFITSVLSQRISFAKAESYFHKRAAKGSAAKMLALLNKAPNTVPEKCDQLK